MGDYRRPEVWQRAHSLVPEVYAMTAEFPPEERFGLTGQMRRAAISVAANIAEGSGRGSDADFARFIRMSAGSVNELEYHSSLAQDLGLVAADRPARAASGCEQVRRMLARLLERLAAGDR